MRQIVLSIFFSIAMIFFALPSLWAQSSPVKLDAHFVHIQTPRRTLKTSSEKIEIPETLRNNFTNDVYLSVISITDRRAGYTVRIVDATGATVQMSESPDSCAGCPTRGDQGVIPPKQKLSHVLVISDYYKLRPGKYTVFVTALVHNNEKDEAVWVAANPIKFQIL
jgi:hypothetical protein